jgi:predicted RNA-binding protein with RPS1 domain
LIEEEGKIVVSQKRHMIDSQVELQRGTVVEGTVTGIRTYGAFIDLSGGQAGLLHISQISYDRIDNLNGLFSIGQKIKVLVLDHDVSSGRVSLSTKALEPNPGDILKDANKVFELAEQTAQRNQERIENERAAREAAAKDIVAGLGGAMSGINSNNNNGQNGGNNSNGDALSSIAESIESILASIVNDSSSN